MPVTQSDIANHLGVSQFVVSHALRNTDRVSTETRRRVMEVAKQLNYRPNSAARATREGKFGCVNLLLSSDMGSSALPARLLFGIESVLSEKSINLTLTRVPDEKLIDSDYLPRFLRERSCDGVIINYTDHCPEAFIEQIEQDRLPCIWLNNKRDGDCVFPDDFHGGRSSTVELIRRGYRDIAYVDYAHGDGTDPDMHYSSQDREAGYREAMCEHGLPERVIRSDRDCPAVPATQRVEESKSWLSRPDRPEAVVCYSEAEGIPVAMSGLSLGIAVPQELYVGVISNRTIEMPGYDMTLAHVPEFRTGVATAEAMLQKIERPDEPLPPRAIEFRPAKSAALDETT